MTFKRNEKCTNKLHWVKFFLVESQRFALCKAALADFADKRFEACVNVHVLSQLISLHESFATNLLDAKVKTGIERLLITTHVTYERLLVAMDRHVCLITFEIRTFASANFAKSQRIFLFIVVFLHMLEQVQVRAVNFLKNKVLKI